ncbi:hypothetical protein ACE1TI_00080 [Alteribacillus sp. JSM 102045]
MDVIKFGGVLINDISTVRSDNMPYEWFKNSGLGKERPQ